MSELPKAIKTWADAFYKLYGRRPSKRDREQFVLGIVEGMRIVFDLLAEHNKAAKL